MATLDLTKFSGFKDKSVIGYDSKTDVYEVVGPKDSVSGSTVAEIKQNDGYWSIVNPGGTADYTGLGGFVETDKTWNLTFSKVDGDVVLGSGADSVTVSDAEGARINLGDGKNELNIAQATDTTVTLGDGADSVVVAGLQNSTVRTGAGKDTVQIGATNNTDTVVDLGDGNDFVSINGAATLNLTLGDGKDTVDASSSLFGSGTVTLTDYNVAEDVLVTGYTSVTSVLASKVGSDGSVSVNGGGVVKVNAENGYYAINGQVEKYVAWAAENGSNIDLSSVTKGVTIIGTDNEAVDTLLGGTKADTILAGGGDLVYGGAGNDSIFLANTGSDSVSFVGLAAAGGKDSVSGFTSGAGDNADVVYLFDNSIGEGAKLSLDSKNNLVVTQGSANLTLDGVTTSSNEVTVKIQDNTNNTYAVDFVSGTATVSSADSIASIYYGDTSNTKGNGLNFSSVDDSLVVDLGNTGVFQNTNNAIYAGNFASVTGGKAETILMGSANASESLTAGDGNTTLWGGGAKADVLDGGSSNSATDNVVTYFYTAGDGKDTVKNFVTGTAENNADVLYLSNVAVSGITRDSKAITISTANSTDKLTVQVSSADSDKVIQYTTDGQTVNQVKVGVSNKSNTFTYSSDVQAYKGGKNNTLQVGSDVDDAKIWLDGSKGVSYDSIAKIDARSSSGTLELAGNGSVSETIIGGSGTNSLWGGAGTSNDTLQGTYGGTNTFYFGKGEGNDVISGSSSDDKVVLYNVALGDVTSIDVTSSNMKIGLSDGSTLTVKGMSTTSVSNFELGDGSSWKYDYASKSWSQK